VFERVREPGKRKKVSYMIRWLHKPEGSFEGKVARDEGKETSAKNRPGVAYVSAFCNACCTLVKSSPATLHRQTGVHVTRRFEFVLAVYDGPSAWQPRVAWR
jgi:hypothetical protein